MIKIGLYVSAVLILIMAAVSAAGFFMIPEDMMIARHWSISGEADGFSPRNHVLIGLPALALLLTLIFAAIPFIDPRGANVRRSGGLLMTAWLGALALLAITHAAIILSAAYGVAFDQRYVVTGVGILLVALGNFMAKSRSSWFIGLRTPWTLSSEHAWVAANRTAGFLFFLTGFLAVAAAWMLDARSGFITIVAGAGAAAIIGVVVSYFAWKSDPERAS